MWHGRGTEQVSVPLPQPRGAGTPTGEKIPLKSSLQQVPQPGIKPTLLQVPPEHFTIIQGFFPNIHCQEVH